MARLSFSVAEGAAWSPSSAVMVILTVLMALTSLCVPVSKRACHCVRCSVLFVCLCMCLQMSCLV